MGGAGGEGRRLTLTLTLTLTLIGGGGRRRGGPAGMARAGGTEPETPPSLLPNPHPNLKWGRHLPGGAPTYWGSALHGGPTALRLRILPRGGKADRLRRTPPCKLRRQKHHSRGGGVGSTVAPRWHISGATVAPPWRHGGASVAPRWRLGGATVGWSLGFRAWRCQPGRSSTPRAPLAMGSLSPILTWSNAGVSVFSWSKGIPERSSPDI